MSSSTPFLGSQLTMSPKFGELEGNYRFYGWWAGYNHAKLDSDRNAHRSAEKGYGAGLSADQQLSRDDRAFRPLRLEQRGGVRRAVGSVGRA